jgi:glycosyltransferase involved in cell wall biosynthesis
MEGFGIPPLEAMSVGCPAIVSDIPVFHEVLGDAAVYFNQNDPEDMARVIKKTLGDMRGLREMKEKGYRQAKKYSWEKLVRETYKVYESCVSL